MVDHPVDLWTRLSRCGRLPTSSPENNHAAVRTWLADYPSAINYTAEDPSFSDALESFVASLPMAEKTSGAFYPSQVRESETKYKPADNVLVENATYVANDGARIGCVLMSPVWTPPGTEELPLLIRWGGNGELAAKQVQTRFLNMVANGILRCIFVDHRGYGWSDGKPSLEWLRNDADAFYCALPQFLGSRGLQWPTVGPILMGRSIGSVCALHVAILHATDFAAVVLDSPVACHWPFENVPKKCWDDLVGVLRPLHAANRKLIYCDCCCAGALAQSSREAAWLDSFDLVQCLDAPLLLLCGGADVLCPRQSIKTLFESAASAKKDIIWLAGLNHDEVSGSLEYWNGLVSLVKGFTHA